MSEVALSGNPSGSSKYSNIYVPTVPVIISFKVLNCMVGFDWNVPYLEVKCYLHNKMVTSENVS